MKNILFTAASLVMLSNLTSAQSGSLDQTFGNNGIVTTANTENLYAVAIQSDGKIVAAGSIFVWPGNDFAMVRYDSSGAQDSSFGNNGKVVTCVMEYSPGHFNAKVYAIAIQGDGKIILAGAVFISSSNTNFAMVRYKTNSEVDSSFGNNGRVITPIGNINDEVSSMAIQKDGKIILAGNSNNGTNFDFAMARYSTSGLVDSSFGNNGIVIAPIGNSDDYASSIALQVDGKILLGGSTGAWPSIDFAIARFDTSGQLDNSFGSNGKVVTSLGNNPDRATSMVLLASGKIIQSGFSDNGSNNDFAMVRYSNTGTIDSSFGNNGIVISPITTNDSEHSNAIALQSDGKIILGGWAFVASGNTDFAIARYDTSGAIDNSFGNNGKVITSLGTGYDFGNALAIQADGKIILAGSSDNVSSYDFSLVRYNSGLSTEIQDLSYKIRSALIFPNPNNGSFTVDVPVESEIVFELYNVAGELVSKQQLMPGTKHLTLNNTPIGFYIAKFVDKQQILYETKLVVQ